MFKVKSDPKEERPPTLRQRDSGHSHWNRNGIPKDLDWKRSRRDGSICLWSLVFLLGLLLIDDGHNNAAFPVATVHLKLLCLRILDDPTPGSY